MRPTRSKDIDDFQMVFGRKPVLEALESGKYVEVVWIQDSVRGPYEKELRGLCRKHNVPLKTIPKIKLDKTTSQRHQGVLAMISLVEYQRLENVLPYLYEQGKEPFLLMLDGVQDVRNMGAIARTAEVFGVDALILPYKKSASINGMAIKTSAGALTHLPVCREKNSIAALELLQQSGIKIFASHLSSSAELYDIYYDGPLCIVIGSEGQGVQKAIIDGADQIFRIKQFGQTDSLNVSVATGIILHHFRKIR